MNDQLTLLGGVEDPSVRLTERQRFVLDALERAREGLGADEVGALLCERRGKHDRHVRCDWCNSNGRDVLVALRKKGLVRSRRDGSWYALSEREPQAPQAAGSASQPTPGVSAPATGGEGPSRSESASVDPRHQEIPY